MKNISGVVIVTTLLFRVFSFFSFFCSLNAFPITELSCVIQESLADVTAN